jgi:hypothetical protein
VTTAQRQPTIRHPGWHFRYTTFIPLYPLGAGSEALLSLSTLPPLSTLPILGDSFFALKPLASIIDSLPRSVRKALLSSAFGRALMWHMAKAGAAGGEGCRGVGVDGVCQAGPVLRVAAGWVGLPAPTKHARYPIGLAEPTWVCTVRRVHAVTNQPGKLRIVLRWFGPGWSVRVAALYVLYTHMLKQRKKFFAKGKTVGGANKAQWGEEQWGESRRGGAIRHDLAHSATEVQRPHGQAGQGLKPAWELETSGLS